MSQEPPEELIRFIRRSPQVQRAIAPEKLLAHILANDLERWRERWLISLEGTSPEEAPNHPAYRVYTAEDFRWEPQPRSRETILRILKELEGTPLHRRAKFFYIKKGLL